MVAEVNAVSPILIDLRINETRELRFTTGEDYLLVLDNDNPHGTSWYFGEFAQSILTHYLQGAANVSQDSLTVPSNAKVLWFFSPNKTGEFAYYAINGNSNQKSEKGKIMIILAEPVISAENSLIEDIEHATMQEKKKSSSVKEEKRRWLKGGRRD